MIAHAGTSRARRVGQPYTSPKSESIIMINFEATYILRPHLDEDEVAARVESINAAITETGATVDGEPELMGKRRLAYEIDDVREGYYVVVRFHGDKSQATAFERRLRLNESVLRALVIRLEC